MSLGLMDDEEKAKLHSEFVHYIVAKNLELYEEIKKLKEQLKREQDCVDKFVISRFWSKVDVKKKNECWNWRSSISNGYGKFSIDNYPHSAHVISYKYFHGEYDKELWIDHKYMNRSCVNPEHLRLVTPRINGIENSGGTSAENFLKTHCKNGHEFTAENTYLRKHGTYTHRMCKACAKISKKLARLTQQNRSE